MELYLSSPIHHFWSDNYLSTWNYYILYYLHTHFKHSLLRETMFLVHVKYRLHISTRLLLETNPVCSLTHPSFLWMSFFQLSSESVISFPSGFQIKILCRVFHFFYLCFLHLLSLLYFFAPLLHSEWNCIFKAPHLTVTFPSAFYFLSLKSKYSSQQRVFHNTPSLWEQPRWLLQRWYTVSQNFRWN